MKIKILETTKESGTKNASAESESEAKAKRKTGTEESKCEAEEAKDIFEKESCESETKSTKAREEVRRLGAESRLVCVMFDKNSHYKSIFSCENTFTNILQGYSK